MFVVKDNLRDVSNNLLKQIVSEFMLEHPTNVILHRVKVSKHKLLKTLTLLRIAITKDVPDVFEGIVEVDETYIGYYNNERIITRLKMSPMKFKQSQRMCS